MKISISEDIESQEPKTIWGNEKLNNRLLNTEVKVSTSDDVKMEAPSIIARNFNLKSCSICGKKVKSITDHIVSVHSKKNEKCPYCSEAFALKIDLKSHFLSNHKYVKKDEKTCHENIQSNRDYSKNNEKCPYCSEAFTLKTDLKSHLVSFHNYNIDEYMYNTENNNSVKKEFRNANKNLFVEFEQGNIRYFDPFAKN